VTDAWYVPAVSASFTFTARPSIDASGALAITIDQTSIDFNEWYAEVFDVLSFGAFRQAVLDAFREALSSLDAGAYLSTLFSNTVLRGLAALGKLSVDVVPTAATVTVIPGAFAGGKGAVVIGGAVAVADASRTPAAGFVVYRDAVAAGRRIFHAEPCWAPGHTIAQMSWDFGDTGTVVRSGTGLRLVETHDYAPGSYVAHLAVTDDAGQTHSYSELVRVGLLALDAAAWIFGKSQTPIDATVIVTEEGEPLPGVTVTVSVPGWHEQKVTGADGRVTFTLDPARFAPLATPQPESSGWSLTHWMQVEASKPGYRAETRRFYLADPQLAITGRQLFPEATAPFAAHFGVHERLDMPVEAALVIARGASGWQTQHPTDASGAVTLMLDPGAFNRLDAPTTMGGAVVKAHMTVEAGKPGFSPAAMTIYIGYELPGDDFWREGLRRRFEAWWRWPAEIAQALGAERVNPAVVEAVADASLALETIADVIALGERRSPTLSVVDLLGLDTREGRLEDALPKRLDEFAAQVETNLTAVRTMVDRARGQKPSGTAKGAVLERPAAGHASHDGWATRAQGLQRAAAVIAQLSPADKALPAEIVRALRLLGRLALLAERRSRVLPVALLLGVGKDDAPRAVARRIDALLRTMRERMAARVLDEAAPVAR
jgi:hypothetical protein